MSEKEEKYPQLILETDGTYEIEIEDGVKVKFDSAKSIEEFTKNKNFSIKGMNSF
ncbi:MAG: hypothetical protein KO253_04555 [Methanobrevibacter arboriphilus]|nr:hypothetical protein [Methanobrevibacter arboriphilus]